MKTVKEVMDNMFKKEEEYMDEIEKLQIKIRELTKEKDGINKSEDRRSDRYWEICEEIDDLHKQKNVFFEKINVLLKDANEFVEDYLKRGVN